MSLLVVLCYVVSILAVFNPIVVAADVGPCEAETTQEGCWGNPAMACYWCRTAFACKSGYYYNDCTKDTCRQSSATSSSNVIACQLTNYRCGWCGNVTYPAYYGTQCQWSASGQRPSKYCASNWTTSPRCEDQRSREACWNLQFVCSWCNITQTCLSSTGSITGCVTPSFACSWYTNKQSCLLYPRYCGWCNVTATALTASCQYSDTIMKPLDSICISGWSTSPRCEDQLDIESCYNIPYLCYWCRSTSKCQVSYSNWDECSTVYNTCSASTTLRDCIQRTGCGWCQDLSPLQQNRNNGARCLYSNTGYRPLQLCQSNWTSLPRCEWMSTNDDCMNVLPGTCYWCPKYNNCTSVWLYGGDCFSSSCSGVYQSKTCKPLTQCGYCEVVMPASLVPGTTSSTLFSNSPCQFSTNGTQPATCKSGWSVRRSCSQETNRSACFENVDEGPCAWCASNAYDSNGTCTNSFSRSDKTPCFYNMCANQAIITCLSAPLCGLCVVPVSSSSGTTSSSCQFSWSGASPASCRSGWIPPLPSCETKSTRFDCWNHPQQCYWCESFQRCSTSSLIGGSCTNNICVSIGATTSAVNGYQTTSCTRMISDSCSWCAQPLNASYTRCQYGETGMRQPFTCSSGWAPGGRVCSESLSQDSCLNNPRNCYWCQQSCVALSSFNCIENTCSKNASTPEECIDANKGCGWCNTTLAGVIGNCLSATEPGKPVACESGWIGYAARVGGGTTSPSGATPSNTYKFSAEATLGIGIAIPVAVVVTVVAVVVIYYIRKQLVNANQGDNHDRTGEPTPGVEIIEAFEGGHGEPRPNDPHEMVTFTPINQQLTPGREPSSGPVQAAVYRLGVVEGVVVAPSAFVYGHGRYEDIQPSPPC